MASKSTGSTHEGFQRLLYHFENLKKRLEESEERSKAYEAESIKHKQELDIVRKDLEATKSECDTLRTERDDRVTLVSTSAEAGAGAGRQDITTIMSLAEEILDLKAQIEHLTQTIEQSAPILHVGYNIRAAFMETTKPLMPEMACLPTLTGVLKDAQIAAHQGDILADSAMFQTGFIPNDDVIALEIFWFMYGTDPHGVKKTWPVLYRRLKNCAATVNAIRDVDAEGLGGLKVMREVFWVNYYRALEPFQGAFADFGDMEVVAAIDADEGHRRLVEGVENLCEGILKIGRSVKEDKEDVGGVCCDIFNKS